MSKTAKTVDRRVLKTKKAIRNAFAKLLTEKDINDITIKDIAELANINRKTFYNYYSGVHGVVEDMEKDILASYDEVFGDVDFARDMRINPHSLFQKVTAIINIDPEFFSLMMNMDKNIQIVNKMLSLLKEKARAAMRAQLTLDEHTVDVVADFMFSGLIAVYQGWYRSGRKAPVEKVSEAVSVMCFNGINGLIEAL